MSMIPLFSVWMNKNVHKEVRKVLESGFIGQGPKVEEFESVLKDYIGNPYISTMNSATSAEHLALHMLKKPMYETFDGCAQRESWPGLEKGDEVVAASGIIGRIKDIKGDYVSIEVSENITFKLQKTAISNVLPKGTIASID